MIANWIALCTGIVGAVSGLGSVAWNVRSWKREGPLLRVTARVSGRGDDMIVRGMIRNAGRFETTVTDVYIIWAQHDAMKVMREKGVSEAVSSVQVPTDGHLLSMMLPQVIKAQSRVEFTITAISAIDPRIPRDVEADAILRVTFETAAGDFVGHSVMPEYRDRRSTA